MKKKPIYLWVLLILSALISAMSLFGMLSPLPSKEALRAAQKQVAGVSAQQLEDQLNYNYGVAEAYHSIFNMALIVLSAILVVVAIVFLIRKNLQYAKLYLRWLCFVSYYRFDLWLCWFTGRCAVGSR